MADEQGHRSAGQSKGKGMSLKGDVSMTVRSGKPTQKKKTLKQLYAMHKGKVSDTWSSYLVEYERILAEYRDRPVRLLEIGVQNGGSLEIWSQYFANARKIVGCDIDPACARLSYDDTRVAVVLGNANSDAVEAVILEHAEAFDIIIDDGSHHSSDIVKSFARYFPHVTDGGVYIAEDLHCSYWRKFGGGLYDPLSSITFFKRLTDAVNHEHWGIEKSRADILSGFFSKYDSHISEETLQTIHSVQFGNSLCIVRKDTPEGNRLSSRVIVGSVAMVEPEVLHYGSRPTPLFDQSNNEWTARNMPPDEELPLRIEELAERDGRIEALSAELKASQRAVAERDGRIESIEAQLAAEMRVISDLLQQVLRRRRPLRDLRVRLHQRWRRHSWRWARPVLPQVTPTEFVAAAFRALLHREADSEAIQHYSEVLRRGRPQQKVLLDIATSAEFTGYVAERSRREQRLPHRHALVTALYELILHRSPDSEGLAAYTRKLDEGLTARDLTMILLESEEFTRLLARCLPTATAYELWRTTFDYQPERDRSNYVATLAGLPWHPKVSILMPVYNPNPADLEGAIRSVENQIYQDWELRIADDASANTSVKSILEAAALRDGRIKVVYSERKGHISEATNSAFALATGDYIGLLDHDDVLREHALAEIVIALNNRSDAELLYSDEDKLSESGERYDAHFKPDFSPDLFYSMNYLNHFTVHRAENIRKVGGWRKGFEGSQDYDINLRIIETIDPRKIVHIPKILYHWRAAAGSTARAGSEKSYAYTAGFRALEDHVARRGLPAKVENVEGSPFYRLRWNVPRPEPLVSLIIPTRDMVDVLRTCVSSIIGKTTYSNYEILVVDNESRDAATLKYFAELSGDPRIRVLSYAKPFNYSAINNFAARQARGSILGLVNNDIEVIAPEWLEEMVAHAMRPEIGCVGAKLLYPDDTIQHAGVVLGVGGVAGHGHLRHSRTSPGYFGRLCVCQNVSAVTAACLVLRADVFWQVGGLDEEHLAIAFNDVDLCLKVREAGYLNLFTPFALLYHHESLSRGQEDTPEKKVRFAGEVEMMKERWGEKLMRDPFYSPNFSLDKPDFQVRIF